MKKVILVTLVLIYLIIMLSGVVLGEVVATLNEVMKPGGMNVNKDNIYITEGTTIYIYSTVDYKLKKKFGKAGEGPKEFNRFAILMLQKDKLIVNSMNKVSFFTKDGEYIEEKKVKSGFGLLFQPLGKNYIGRGFGQEKNTRFDYINLYDSELKKLKTLIKVESDQQFNKCIIKFLNNTLTFVTFNEKLYIVNGNKFEVKVFDNVPEEILTIKRDDYKREKFGDKDKQMIFDEIKNSPQKQFLETAKKMARFPDYYPAIAQIFERDGLIYIMTYKREGDKYEFYKYDSKGKFIKHFFIKFSFRTTMQPNPFSIMNDKLYQIIENEDTEEWELHVNDIK